MIKQTLLLSLSLILSLVSSPLLSKKTLAPEEIELTTFITPPPLHYLRSIEKQLKNFSPEVVTLEREAARQLYLNLLITSKEGLAENLESLGQRFQKILTKLRKKDCQVEAFMLCLRGANKSSCRQISEEQTVYDVLIFLLSKAQSKVPFFINGMIDIKDMSCLQDD